MRIGIFTNVYKPEINGVVTSISTFRDELVRQGHAVYIFAPEAGDYEDEEYGIFRYPAIKVPDPINFPLAIPVSPFIDWVVPRLKLDILHSQHPVLIGEEAVTFARELELPHVFTHHTRYEEYSHYIPFNQNIAKTLTREVVRTHMVRSVRTITPTQSIKDQLSAQAPDLAERLFVLPTPIRLECFSRERLKPQPLRQKHDLKGRFVFISLARLTPEKNFPMLLKAFARATADYAGTRLLIVGDGTSRKELEQLARELEIASRVIFTGFVPQADVPNYLAAADVFAFASTSETQGIVMAEGMAAGLPVVAVDGPGNRDVVRHEVNGLLTEPNVEALAAGLSRILLENELKKKLAAGALKTATEYAPDRLTGQMLDLYAEAIEAYEQAPLTYKRFPRDPEQSRQFPPAWLTELTGGERGESVSSFWQRLGRYLKIEFD